MAILPNKRFIERWDSEAHEIFDAQQDGWLAIRVGETLVRVKADLRVRNRPEVRLEFSAPAVLCGHNRDPLAVTDADELFRCVVDAISQELPGFIPRYELFRLTRLDIARDWSEVEDFPRTLNMLYQLHAGNRVRIDSLQRGAAGRSQSLTRGNTGRWRGVLYGKGEELRERASRARSEEQREQLLRAADESPRRLRWELQLMGHVLSDRHLRDPAELYEDHLLAVSQHYFRITRFDSVLGGYNRVQQALEGLGDPIVRGVLALLSAELLGLPAPMCRNSFDQYRRYVRRYGLSGQDLINNNVPSRRLDLPSGREIVGGQLEDHS